MEKCNYCLNLFVMSICDETTTAWAGCIFTMGKGDPFLLIVFSDPIHQRNKQKFWRFIHIAVCDDWFFDSFS